MAATTWTESDFTALEAAIKQGIRTVSYDGRSVTYHSLAEMLQLRATMRAALDTASSADVRYRFATFTKD